MGALPEIRREIEKLTLSMLVLLIAVSRFPEGVAAIFVSVGSVSQDPVTLSDREFFAQTRVNEERPAPRFPVQHGNQAE